MFLCLGLMVAEKVIPQVSIVPHLDEISMNVTWTDLVPEAILEFLQLDVVDHDFGVQMIVQVHILKNISDQN